MSDDHYVWADCPACGAEHRVHKLKAARGTVRCKNCKTMFAVMNQTAQESAFLAAFGRVGCHTLLFRVLLQI